MRGEDENGWTANVDSLDAAEFLDRMAADEIWRIILSLPVRFREVLLLDLKGACPGSEREEWTVVMEIDDYLINYQEKARLLNVFFPLSDGRDGTDPASRKADPPAG